MKIGYAVQGSTDRAFLMGLRDRWCFDAEMIEGAFRGTTGLSLRREISKICDELFRYKGCDVLIILTDADATDWREVKRNEFSKVPQSVRALVVYGVADRNIECWLCADREYIAERTGRRADDFRRDDPKNAFESAMGVSRDDRKEKEIAAMIMDAPSDVLKRWLGSPSFEDFFDQLWTVSRRRGCTIENLRTGGA